ncbi:hypothetical protein SRABI106_04227 [Rahnella aquatilis]|nr:hypothetical protein SRABI106_04227 [Rahnella aquatilis]
MHEKQQADSENGQIIEESHKYAAGREERRQQDRSDECQGKEIG